MREHGVALPADQQHEPTDRARERNLLGAAGSARIETACSSAGELDGTGAGSSPGQRTARPPSRTAPKPAHDGQQHEVRPARSPLGRELDRLGLRRASGLRGAPLAWSPASGTGARRDARRSGRIAPPYPRWPDRCRSASRCPARPSCRLRAMFDSQTGRTLDDNRNRTRGARARRDRGRALRALAAPVMSRGTRRRRDDAPSATTTGSRTFAADAQRHAHRHPGPPGLRLRGRRRRRADDAGARGRGFGDLRRRGRRARDRGSGGPVVATIGLSEAETNHIARMGFPDYRGARAIEVAFSGDIDAPRGARRSGPGSSCRCSSGEPSRSLLGVLTRDESRRFSEEDVTALDELGDAGRPAITRSLSLREPTSCPRSTC